MLRGLLFASAMVTLQSRAAAQLAQKLGSTSGRLAYNVPASCADAASWMEEVLARLEPDARELARRELPALIESLEVTPDGKRAFLRLRSAAGARGVVGDDCSEVLTGAALIAAIAFGAGPERRTASAPEPRDESEPPERPIASPSIVLERDVAAARGRSRDGVQMPDASRIDPVVVDSGARERALPPAAAMRWAIGAGAGARTGLAPWPAGVLDGALELSWPDRGWSVRVRGLMGLSRARVEERSARFSFVGSGFDLCPLTVGAHLDWQWRSCVGFELGRVLAEGEAQSALRTAEKRSMWWAAPALVTRLQSPTLYGIRFEAEAGGSLPLWHWEFEFRDPDVSVFETPVLALTTRVGLQVPLE